MAENREKWERWGKKRIIAKTNLENDIGLPHNNLLEDNEILCRRDVSSEQNR